MKRGFLRKVGRLGTANKQARDRIAVIAEEKGLDYCEIGFDGCQRNWTLAPAHRHKRAWYKGDVEKLSDYQQWVAACVSCHAKIEVNPELTEEVFMRLRGEE